MTFCQSWEAYTVHRVQPREQVVQCAARPRNETYICHVVLSIVISCFSGVCVGCRRSLGWQDGDGDNALLDGGRLGGLLGSADDEDAFFVGQEL